MIAAGALLRDLPVCHEQLVYYLPKVSSNNSDQKTRKWVKYLAGTILGTMFFTIYFPLITHTYNEVLSNSQPVWPSFVSIIYFEMTNKIGIFLIPPRMMVGLLEVVFAYRILDLKEKRGLVTSETV